MKLTHTYYQQENTVAVAKDLLGKVIHSHIDQQHTSAIITETEAYVGTDDRACHAFGGRRTARNEAMYQAGGCTYVYLCYGMHHLLNIVTHKRDQPHAVLIRAIEPLVGVELMQQRRGNKTINNSFSNGPGKVSQSLGIRTEHNGVNLCGPTVWIEDQDIQVNDNQIQTGARVGVEYAKEDAQLPYRFILNSN